jgi:hypothetical protein
VSSFESKLADIYTALNDSTVLFVRGKANEGKDGPRRRVHFYRRGGVLEPPARTANWAQNMTANESRFTRVEEIEAAVMAEDEENVSILFDNLAHAIEKAFPGDSARLKLGNYEWQENEIAQRTPLIRWRFALAFPANPEQTTLREVDAVNNVSEFE